jgi:RimJ/RimL family protein N-acetyltransferase
MHLEPMTTADAPRLSEIFASIGMLAVRADGTIDPDASPWIRLCSTTLTGRKLMVDGVMVGGGQLTPQKYPHAAELGFWIDRPLHRRGYGTAVVRLFIRLAFEELRLHRLCAKTFANNLGSIGSCEKAGMRREGVLRDVGCKQGVYYDEIHFGILATDPRPT